ncbi:MAG: MFS transporter [Ktedonobacterales bacterium]|nr:MFS transporter [Ktedonobacterales bacterium]
MAQSPTTAPARSGFRSTLRNRFFQRLWLAQILSQTVQNATNYGSIVLLAQVSHSSTAVGGVIIAFSLPAVLFGVPAGVLVDRMDKRLILWVSNGLRAVASFGFVVAILSDSHNYLLIYLLTFLISVIGQFFGPAEGTAIPLLVGEGDLVPALSLFNVTFSVSQALGFIILGPLIVLGMPTVSFPIGTAVLTLTSIHWLFLFIGCTYLICAFLTWSIPRDTLIGARNPNSQATGQRIGNVWHGVVEAWTFVRHNRPLFIAVLQLTLGGSVITIISMIAPSFSDQFMHRPAALAGIVFVPAGLGLISGSVLMPRIIERLGLKISEGVGVVGVSGCTVLLTLCHWFAVRMDPANWPNDPLYLLAVVVTIFCLGLSLDLITLPAQTELQRRSPDWIKGRVLALQMMFLNAAAIPIILVVGSAADTMGLPVAMNLIAISVITLGLGSIYLAEQPAGFFSHLLRPKAAARQPVLPEDGPSFKGAQSNPLPRVLSHDHESAPAATRTPSGAINRQTPTR